MLSQADKPVDAMTLRIDEHERLAHQLNDIEIASSECKLSYVRQRGWTLPQESIAIPNLIRLPEAAHAAAIKPVWRIAFFSQLQESKGIKVFVEAVSQLNTSNLANFEVGSSRQYWVQSLSPCE